MAYFIKAWDWIKGIVQKGLDYFHQHELIAIIVLISGIVLIYYIFAFLFQTGSFNKKLTKKLKKVNVIMRNYQLKGDRENFLFQFNKETAKKQKAFSNVWNAYLKGEAKVAGEFFKESGLKPKHKRFLGATFFISVLLSLGASVALLLLTKFDFQNVKNIYIPIFALFYPFALAGLFQSILYSVSNKQEKIAKSHLKFFIENIDESLAGFTKDDLNLTGGKPSKVRRTDNPNVETYDKYVASGKSELTDLDREYLDQLAREKLAEQKVSESLAIVEDEIEEGINAGHLEVEKDKRDGISKGYSEQSQLLKTLNKLKQAPLTPKVQTTEELDGALEEQDEAYVVRKSNKKSAGSALKKSSYLDEEENVTQSLEELIAAKKARVEQKEKSLASKQAGKSKTSTASKQKPKRINDALEELLASAKRNNKK